LKWLVVTSDVVVFGHLNVTLYSMVDSFCVSEEPSVSIFRV